MRNIFLNRNFALLATGMTVSRIGSWIDFIGLNLYVYNTFGSGKILGTFLMSRMLPSIIFGPLGGYISDHYSRRKIMIICDTVRAFLVMGFIFTKDLFTFFAIGIMLSALDKIYTAANNAFLPDIVKKEEIMEANSIIKMAASTVTILGAMAGGIIVSSLNFSWIFIIDSLTFIFSIICVILISNVKEIEKKDKKRENPWEEFRDTLIFLRTEGAILFLIIIKLIDALGSGAYNTGIPLFSKVLGISRGGAYGWLIAAWSAGEFAGSLLTKYISKRFNIGPEKFFSLSVLLMALGMGCTFHFKNLYYAMISIFMGGFGDGLSNVVFFTVLMKDTPDNMRGKIIGTVASLIVSTVALGMAISGFFMDKNFNLLITDVSTGFILISVLLGLVFFIVRRKS